MLRRSQILIVYPLAFFMFPYVVLHCLRIFLLYLKKKHKHVFFICFAMCCYVFAMFSYVFAMCLLCLTMFPTFYYVFVCFPMFLLCVCYVLLCFAMFWSCRGCWISTRKTWLNLNTGLTGFSYILYRIFNICSTILSDN